MTTPESSLTPVTLASGSAVRRTMLAAAGVWFDAVSPGVDEDALKLEWTGDEPATLAGSLAEAKALSVSEDRPGLVIGADQVLAFDGRIWDKARTMEEARDRLSRLRGQPHELIGGVVLAEGDSVLWRHIAVSRLYVRDFSDDFLDWYLATAGDQILSSVGCYQFEGLGAQLFDRVEGGYFAILGMDLPPLLNALRAHGGLIR